MRSVGGNNGVTEELIRQPYYHGFLPREDVPEFLKKPGDFLLRVTEPIAGKTREVVISVMTKEKNNKGAHIVST
jgi:hypothetical protein